MRECRNEEAAHRILGRDRNYASSPNVVTGSFFNSSIDNGEHLVSNLEIVSMILRSISFSSINTLPHQQNTYVVV